MLTYLPHNSLPHRPGHPGAKISPPSRGGHKPPSAVSAPRGAEIRKRGGQPGNSNAFRHGLYSAHSPHTRATPLDSSPAEKDPSIMLKDLQDRLIAVGKRELRNNHHKLAHCLAVSRHGLPHNEMLSQVRLATIIVGKNLKIFRSLFELGGRQEHLRSLVRDLPALMRWEFFERGIPAPSAFVPQELDNLHANLSWESPHLTDAQWLLLQETFISLHADLDYFRKYRRRKPLPSDRFLLEGILWKLANGLRWRDLAGKYPLRRCQELYSALFRSGRMQTIYRQLEWYLDFYGGSTLRALVQRGCFVISGNQVLLAPSEKPTWEKYTALLLLQQAYHARWSIHREDDRERRRHGNYYRLPPLRVPGSPHRSARSSAPPSSYSSSLYDPNFVHLHTSWSTIDSPPAGLVYLRVEALTHDPDRRFLQTKSCVHQGPPLLR